LYIDCQRNHGQDQHRQAQWSHGQLGQTESTEQGGDGANESGNTNASGIELKN